MKRRQNLVDRNEAEADQGHCQTKMKKENLDLDFRNHCFFCLKEAQDGAVVQEVVEDGSKMQFRPLLESLMRTRFSPGGSKAVGDLINSPPMCEQCGDLVGELHRLRELMLDVREEIRDTVRGTVTKPFVSSKRNRFYEKLGASGMKLEHRENVYKFVAAVHDKIIAADDNRHRDPLQTNS